MTYFIIRNTLIMIYLFYYLHKNLNKTNGQTRSLKIKNDTFNVTEGVFIKKAHILNQIKEAHIRRLYIPFGPPASPEGPTLGAHRLIPPQRRSCNPVLELPFPSPTLSC